MWAKLLYEITLQRQPLVTVSGDNRLRCSDKLFLQDYFE